MITGFVLRTQRYKKSDLQESMSHYSDAFPFHLDVGQLDTPIPPNFKDQNYEFFYNGNKTKFHLESTGFNGTESVIKTDAFEYRLVGSEFQAHFKVSQPHYPLYFSKLVLDGYIDGLLANLKIDFVWAQKGGANFNFVRITISRKWGDSFNIDLTNNLFHNFDQAFLILLLLVLGWWLITLIVDISRYYQSMREKNLIYTLWYKLEIGIDLSIWQLMQRRRKLPEFLRRMGFINIGPF